MKKTSVEDYLRVMYSLHEKNEGSAKGIKSIDIAKELGITKPSVCVMIRKLKAKRYITFEPYSDIFLSARGLKEARRVTHNHRVIEVFLKKILDYDLKKVHQEAHNLEHTFSQESIKRLDKFLHNPKISPSGKIIPHDRRLR